MVRVDISPTFGIALSICLMASTIELPARVVLQSSSQPWLQAMLMAGVSNAMRTPSSPKRA